MNTYFNNSETNNFYTPFSDNVIGNSNFTRTNVHTKSSFHKLITQQKGTDTESSMCSNDEINDDINKSEGMSSHKISA